jgi:ankyrin repeat protein
MRKAHSLQKTKRRQEIQDKVQTIYESLKEQKGSAEGLNVVRAAYNGNYLAVKVLLDNGADVAKKTGLGKTALHVAAMNGNEELV